MIDVLKDKINELQIRICPVLNSVDFYINQKGAKDGQNKVKEFKQDIQAQSNENIQ
jgi:hypothetical protein